MNDESHREQDVDRQLKSLLGELSEKFSGDCLAKDRLDEAVREMNECMSKYGLEYRFDKERFYAMSFNMALAVHMLAGIFAMAFSKIMYDTKGKVDCYDIPACLEVVNALLQKYDHDIFRHRMVYDDGLKFQLSIQDMCVIDESEVKLTTKGHYLEIYVLSFNLRLTVERFV